VAAKLDRLSRSMLDFAALMATAQKQSWALEALDCAVDTSTPAGEAMAHVLATFWQFERRLIGQRTEEALAAKKGQLVSAWADRRRFRKRSSGVSSASVLEATPCGRSPVTSTRPACRRRTAV
jgi:DNA invertase Pin-like site-specific DNA recombinase